MNGLPPIWINSVLAAEQEWVLSVRIPMPGCRKASVADPDILMNWAMAMNLSAHQSKIAFDERPELPVTVNDALFSRLSKLPRHSNDNRGVWFLEAGFSDAEDSGVKFVPTLQFLRVRIAP